MLSDAFDVHWIGVAQAAHRLSGQSVPGLMFARFQTRPSDALVVGQQGTVAPFDGTTWQSVETGSRADPNRRQDEFLRFGPRSGRGRYHVRDDGSAWRADSRPIRAKLLGIWENSANDLFIIGDDSSSRAVASPISL